MPRINEFARELVLIDRTDLIDLLTNGCSNSLDAEGLSSGLGFTHWLIKSRASFERPLGTVGPSPLPILYKACVCRINNNNGCKHILRFEKIVLYTHRNPNSQY
jgi:hypothetical protein